MKILFLTNNPNTQPLSDWLIGQGEDVEISGEHSTVLGRQDVRLVLSYNYGKIIEPKYFRLPGVKFINLHISYLPWSGGAHPTLWSVLEYRLLGVTIHWMTPEIDSGGIIWREVVPYSETDTLKEIYERQHAAIQDAFKSEWSKIKELVGSYHHPADIESVKDKLINGWDTTVEELRRAK